MCINNSFFFGVCICIKWILMGSNQQTMGYFVQGILWMYNNGTYTTNHICYMYGSEHGGFTPY